MSRRLIIGAALAALLACDDRGGAGCSQPSDCASGAPSVSGVSPERGPAGTTVTIGGSGFGTAAGAVQVEFDGVAAAIVAVTDTELVVTAPSHGAGVVAVVVKVGGVAAASSLAFTYEAVTPAVVSGILPAKAWPGQTVTISGTNFSANAQDDVVMFGSLPAQVTAASASELSVVVPPSGVGTAQVSVAVNGVTAGETVAFTYQSEIEVVRLASLPADAVIASPSTFGDHAGFAIGGKGYVVNSAGLTYEYDPTTDSWTKKASLTNPRTGAWGFTIGSLGYVAFGQSHDGDVAAYDPAGDSWSQLNMVGTLGIAGIYQPYGTAIAVGNQVIVGNGAYSKLYTGTIAAGTLTWTQTVSYPDPTVSTPLAFSNGKVAYWGGGYSITGWAATFYRLDPVSGGSWTRVVDLPATMDRYFQDDMFTLGNVGYVVNDRDSSRAPVMWEFDFQTEAWRAVPFAGRLGANGWQVVSFTIGDTAYQLYSNGSFFSIRDLGPNPYAN